MKRVAPALRPCLSRALIPRRQFGNSVCLARKEGRASFRKTTSPPEERPLPPASKIGPKPDGTSKHASSNTYYYFRLLVQKHLSVVLEPFRNPKQNKHVLDGGIQFRAYGFDNPQSMRQCATAFGKLVEEAFNLAQAGKTSRADNSLFFNLRNGFVRGNTIGLENELRFAFRLYAGRNKFDKGVLVESTREAADLRHPYEWFPATRALQRTVHLHVGPTNSGKTYNALQALEKAKTGIYAGPLRLLAHEIFGRIGAKGRDVALLTGEEQRFPENPDVFLLSCTVEMTPIGLPVDVAVIDEIQMIADPSRGAAWTNALVGLQARELHLCGEERTVDLVRSLCAKMGDKVIVHHYKRLNKLTPVPTAFGTSFKKLEKGDAVVAFSRKDLHSMKAVIERQTGRRCAIVYGNLPPETRAEQAALFNQQNNDYDFIVASDAIGMGLNLEIRRVVFSGLTKYDGVAPRFLTIPEIKQIGGRAGRFRSAAQDMRGNTQDATPAAEPLATTERPGGLVTCMGRDEIKRMREAFSIEPEPIKAAGLSPPPFIIEQFSTHFAPDTPLGYIILALRQASRLTNEFFLCDVERWIHTADLLYDFPMAVVDACVFLNSPLQIRSSDSKELFQEMAKCVSQNKVCHLLDLKKLRLEELDTDPNQCLSKGNHLRDLEILHQGIILYLWLSYRFSGIFTSQRLAFEAKALVEEKIRDMLDTLDHRPKSAGKKAWENKMIERRLKQQRLILGEDVDEVSADDEEGLLRNLRKGTSQHADPGLEMIEGSVIPPDEPSQQKADSQAGA